MTRLSFHNLDINGIVRKKNPSLTKQVKPAALLFKPEITNPEKIRFYVRPNSGKGILTFALLSLVFVFVFNSFLYLSSAKNASGEILGLSTSAYAELNSAGTNLESRNFAQAKTLFDNAQNSLSLAQSKLETYKALKLIAPEAKSADFVLDGAYALATAGKKLTLALGLFDELKVSSAGVENQNFYQQLSANRTLLAESLQLLDSSANSFSKATGLPPEYQHALETAQAQVGKLRSVLSSLISLEDLYLAFVGEKPKTYLVVFQNYDELRATGGFIGTYGVAKINNGKINKLKINSVYDLDGNIFEQVAAPGPFQPAIKKWSMRDSNWFVDFPQSAQKLLYFFEKGGETADGVVATNPKLFEGLLQLTGPIPMDNYGVVLTSENFQEIIQYKTSVDYDKDLNQPKKLLTELAPVLLDRLQNLKQEDWLVLLQILQDNLADKSLIVYSKDAAAEAKIASMGYGGKIQETEKDYLGIFASNMAGTKNDLQMSQDIKLRSKILSDGSVISTLSIARKNSSGEQNKSYMRVLVPEGSTLIAASGFQRNPQFESTEPGFRTDSDLEIWDQGELKFDQVFVRAEAGKTEFAGWSKLLGGETEELTLVYSLPFRFNMAFLAGPQNYSLLFQKQPGVMNLKFESILDFGLFNSRWESEEVDIKDGLAIMHYTAPADQYWGVVLSR